MEFKEQQNFLVLIIYFKLIILRIIGFFNGTRII